MPYVLLVFMVAFYLAMIVASLLLDRREYRL